MRKRSISMLAGVLWLALLVPAFARAGDVHALFDLDTPTGSPFPSDRFTVADAHQLTGIRVNLPKPDCQERISDCQDLAVINTLDGFNVQPRLSIPFDGMIDVQTVSSDTVFLIRLCGVNGRHHDHSAGACESEPIKVGVNQIVWDTFTNTLHVESDELLEQRAQYALIVTTGVRDSAGSPIGAADAFRHFRQSVRHPYKQALLDAVHAARRLGVREAQIAAASVFTTRSVTTTLEQIRDQIKAASPTPADFLLGPSGGRTVFPLSDMVSVAVTQQTGTAPTFTKASLALTELRNSLPGAVGSVAFGRFLAPDYHTHPGEFIPSSPTRTGSPSVQGVNELYFNLVLPSGTPPSSGWPVAIAGHGAGGSKEGSSLGSTARISAALAARGIASIHFNFIGHGFGALGTLTVNRASGPAVTLPAGGRGHDQDGDGAILPTEGRAAAPPQTIVEESDGIRQSVADLMRLVRLIQVGIDVDGDALPDLDASRIYFFGQSYGAVIGTVFLAVEPDVRVGVITAAGGSWPARIISPTNRPAYGQALARRTPSLINSPGVTHIDDVPVPASPSFNENLPLRDGVPVPVRLSDGTNHVITSPVINDVPGASEIQVVIEQYEWVQQWANPVAYARHLRKAPLARIPEKTVLMQFARGDQVVPNPLTSAMLRAGDLADRATLYRHDLASLENPLLPKPGHGFAYVSGFGDISRGAQDQIATFFESDGAMTIQPEPGRFFEVPVSIPLPEDLSFIP